MLKPEFLSELKENKIEYLLDEPMCRHTTFKIGGAAEIYIKVYNTNELKSVLNSIRTYNIPYFVLGRGSNLLVSDKGIDGAVVELNGMDEITVCGETLVCGSGASLRGVCLAALKNSLTGLEFAYGIPGGIGGALYMNAGAYGGEMKDVVVSAKAVDASGEEKFLTVEEMCLGYRTSIFKNSGLIITEVSLKLEKGEENEIRDLMEDIFSRRKNKQPLEFPSAGSTFKRPEGYFAGALIEKNNLKGVRVGGAQVSEKHAGFVINRSDASCADVLTLIKKIQATVFENDGVTLETEVIFVGRE